MIKRALYFQDCIRINDDIWFVSSDYNRLYKYNLKEKKTERSGEFSYESFSQDGLFLKIRRYKNNLIFVPQCSKRIYIYNVDTGLFKDILVPEPTEDFQGQYFFEAVVYKEYIYMMGAYPGILKVNLETYEVEVLDQWLKKLQSEVKINRNEVFLGMEGVLQNHSFWIPCYQCNRVLELNLDSGEFCFYEVGRKGNRYTRMIKSGDQFVLVTHNREDFCRIIFWDFSKGSCEEVQVDMQACGDRGVIEYLDNIWLLSFNSNEIYCVDIKNKRIGFNLVPDVSKAEIVFAKVTNDELFFCDHITGAWYKINNLGVIEKIEGVIHECMDEDELEEPFLNEDLTDKSSSNTEFYEENSEKRKKVWAIELQLLERFDEVCSKHHLTYYVEFGTLLGAVRHKGFIPWDDDVDLVMFRDDYNRLLSIAAEEFKEPYFFQNTHNDTTIIALSKLRDSRTTAIQFPDRKDLNQGIFIDIYPLDDVPYDGEDTTILEIQKELWSCVIKPADIVEAYKNNQKLFLEIDVLINLMKMEIPQKMKVFESFLLEHSGKSEYVNFITHEFFHISKSTKREWYDHVVYLPFEHIEVPAPAGYEQILTRRYRNWQQPLKGGSAHEGIFLDPDVPYTNYIELWEANKHLFQ